LSASLIDRQTLCQTAYGPQASNSFAKELAVQVSRATPHQPWVGGCTSSQFGALLHTPPPQPPAYITVSCMTHKTTGSKCKQSRGCALCSVRIVTAHAAWLDDVSIMNVKVDACDHHHDGVDVQQA
jgi:hypothetical protein